MHLIYRFADFADWFNTEASCALNRSHFSRKLWKNWARIYLYRSYFEMRAKTTNKHDNVIKTYLEECSMEAETFHLRLSWVNVSFPLSLCCCEEQVPSPWKESGGVSASSAIHFVPRREDERVWRSKRVRIASLFLLVCQSVNSVRSPCQTT